MTSNAHTSSTSLLKIANLIIAQYPDDSVALYHRIVAPIIEQTNNPAYREAADLLFKLEKILISNNIDHTLFDEMIIQLSQAYKLKINMMKQLKNTF